MAKPVKWTPEALRTYVSIMRHLQAHWTQREMDRFDREVDGVQAAISMFPRGFRQGDGHGIREAFIKPWNLLIYRVRRDHVELLTFWDTRRDPRKKPRFVARSHVRRRTG